MSDGGLDDVALPVPYTLTCCVMNCTTRMGDRCSSTCTAMISTFSQSVICASS